MARRSNGDGGFTFTNVQIFRDQKLGHGSYGAVYKAKCDSLLCAAKFIHPVLFASNVPQQAAPPQGKEHRQPIRRFEAECQFLSQIKHPNIVQYLGVYHEPGTNEPVLLMELMDESLTHFLESSQNPVLFHLQVNILHDTALALAFLHSNGIIHRDLSSNNVLLIARSRAKVTDFGMSTLTDAVAPHLASMTQCPGTPAYMSPEALDEPPVYSKKLDCFSFGVLAIQVVTKKFPKPTDRFQIMELAHPTHPSLRYQARVLVPEHERRQSHINLIPEPHPLRLIALNCIKDKDAERPTAEQLCETVEQLKSTRLYASSGRQVCDREVQVRTQIIETNQQQLNVQRLRSIMQDKDQQLQDKDQQLQDKDQQLQDKDQQLRDREQQLQDKDQLLQDKDQQLQDKDQLLQDKDQQLQDKDQLLQDKGQQLWGKDKQLQYKDGQIQQQNQQIQIMQEENQQLRIELELKNQQIAALQQGTPQHGQTARRHTRDLQPQLQQLQLSEDQQPVIKKKTTAKELTLTWTFGPKAPITIYRGSSINIGSTVHINPCDSQSVYAFQYNRTSEWLLLPQCPYRNSTLAVIDNVLTTIGGHDSSYKNTTNKVVTYHDNKWVELHPPMPTKRSKAVALSTTTHVVVIGGSNTGRKMTVTEVLDVQTKQWSTASPLPYGIFGASITLCGDVLYLMGGDTDKESNKFSVLYCRLSDLLQSTHFQPLFESTMATGGHIDTKENSGLPYRFSDLIHSALSTRSSMREQPSSSTAAPQPKVWQQNIPNLPLRYSTCVTVQGKVLSIGGKHSQYDIRGRSNAVYELDTDNNKWTQTGNMNIGRSGHLAIALPDHTILVVGGYTNSGVEKDLLGYPSYFRKDTTEIAVIS